VLPALRRPAADGTPARLPFDVHRHDLRRTAATNMGAARVPRAHIGYVLNHTTTDAAAVTKVYDRYARDDEKRAALEAWARRLDAMLAAEAPASVLAFAR
jgi:hypothetical protein